MGKGVLLPVFCLPNKYGIGCFSSEAYEFVDLLSLTCQDYWQVLPLSPTTFGDSPYQSPSSFAGNPYFIDLTKWQEKGYITKKQLDECKYKDKNIDYAWLYSTRMPIFKSAYNEFIKDIPPQFYDFIKENEFWLDDYSLFMALKDNFSGKTFSLWGKYSDINFARENKDKFIDDINFYKFLQFEFFSQWNDLKNYANKKGIKIIGDIPIYVAYDSADVFSHPDLFKLDDEFIPTLVSGVPPDAFSETGQLWGNPIYDWQKHKAQDFSWWLSRIGQGLKNYDYVRIDHFRGFAGYYEIKYGEKTAQNGHWVKGMGKELFTKVKERFPNANIIAEDLGLLDDDVRALLKFTAFPGMKILQFALDCENSEYLPINYPKNCVAYTGTHDNMTSKAFIQNMNDFQKKMFSKYIKVKKGQNRTLAFISQILHSKADMKIIPMFDYTLSLTDRINTPSTSQGNWVVRLDKNYKTQALINRMNRL